MSLTISDALLQAAHMSEAELRQEIAVMLFQRDNSPWPKQVSSHICIASSSNICWRVVRFLCIMMAEFAEDIHTLQRLGRL